MRLHAALPLPVYVSRANSLEKSEHMTEPSITSADVQQVLHVVIADPSRTSELDKLVVDSFHHANESDDVAAAAALRDLIDKILVHLSDAEERHFLKDLLQRIDHPMH